MLVYKYQITPTHQKLMTTLEIKELTLIESQLTKLAAYCQDASVKRNLSTAKKSIAVALSQVLEE